MDAKDYTLGGQHRAEWERAWSAMPHRRLLTPLRIVVPCSFGTGHGELVSVTISADPPQFSAMPWRESERCPVCGEMTTEEQRLPATLHLTLAIGFNYGCGVWVHRACFESCPATDEPTPIPW